MSPSHGQVTSFCPGDERRADRMHAGDEGAVAEHVEHRAAHARHDAHVGHDIRAVGDLHADLGDRRAERAHAERDDVHGAAAHAAVEQPEHRLAHLRRRRPIVGGAGVDLVARADEGPFLDPRHIGRVRAREIGVGALFRIEPDERAGLDHLIAQHVVFFDRAVAPMDAVRLAEALHLVDPGLQALVGHFDRYALFHFHCSLRSPGARTLSPSPRWALIRALTIESVGVSGLDGRGPAPARLQGPGGRPLPTRFRPSKTLFQGIVDHEAKTSNAADCGAENKGLFVEMRATCGVRIMFPLGRGFRRG